MPLIGVRGAALTGEATWQKSEVTDPLTGAQRRISEFQDVAWNIGFRQDLPTMTWGASYTGKSAASSYLLREIDTRRASPSLDAFIEIPLGRRLRLRAAAISLLDQAETRDRLFFEPDRRTPESSAERSERAPGRWYQLSLLGNI